MSSILRKAMLPAAVAIAMTAFIGAFGSATQTAFAADGDICHVDVDSRASAATDGQGNDLYVVERGKTYGLVFRVQDSIVFDVETDAETINASAEWFIEEWDTEPFGPNIHVAVDSETGSARITSKAEILSVDDDAERRLPAPGNNSDDELEVANVGHVNLNQLSTDADTTLARWFNDADGGTLDSINDWLDEYGYPMFADDDANVCGDESVDVDPFETEFYDDAWGFIDFQCIEAGTFHIDIWPDGDTEEEGETLKFLCGGQADKAEIATQRETVETSPTGVAPSGFGTSVITVTVWDQFGDRLDGALVHFSTDNCQFRNTDPTGENPISPAGGGTTVHTISDTDTTNDENFIADNPLQLAAGTAEVLLNCTLPGSTPGVANITAIVEREGADIVLKETVNVVGPTAASGLTLTLDPDEDFDCGDVIKATARAVDSTGAPVSPGTKIRFTTDTSAGIVGGAEGAQGAVTTTDGEASVLIATDPGNPGLHTVIAYALDANDKIVAQTSATYECEGAVAPAPPTVAPPSTGTGTITPPSTGDAGLASGSTSASLFVIAGAVAFVLAGIASVRFARN